MNNPYLKHYENNRISPVRQDLSNLKKHFYVRQKLYEQLGIPALAIKDKNILEIGAGSGHNSIVTYSFSPKTYTIVEPNKTGREQIKELFEKVYNIMWGGGGMSCNVIIDENLIEDFSSKNKFDIIFAEGFIQALSNKLEILNKISSMLNKNGILVITTVDEISSFYENARRLLANMLLKGKENLSFDEKIAIFVDSFETHLKTLKKMTRLTSDWCADSLMGDAAYQQNLYPSLAIKYLEDNFYFYKISPDIILDEIWYKDVPLNIKDYNAHKIQKLDLNWHNLFHYQVFSKQRKMKKNINLSILCKKFVKLCRQSEYENFSNKLKEEILKCIFDIKQNLTGISSKITKSLEELYEIVENDDYTQEKIKNMQNFKSAFGRGQQYLSFIKK